MLPNYVTENDLFDFDFFDFLIICYLNMLPNYVTKMISLISSISIKCVTEMISSISIKCVTKADFFDLFDSY